MTTRSRSFTIVSTLILGLGLAAPLHATPRLQRLTLVQDAPGQLRVRWHDDAAVSASLRYGQEPSRLDQVVAARRTLLTQQEGLFEASIETSNATGNLFYAVGSESTGFSPPQQVLAHRHTETCSAARMVFTGDSRPNRPWGSPQTWIDIQQEIRRFQPDLVVSAGDLIDHGEKLDEWKRFFLESQPMLAESPFVSAIGNHDIGLRPDATPWFNMLVGKGTDTPTKAANYAVQLGPILLALIDTVQVDPKAPGAFAQQAAWLDETLSKSTAPWKIVALHHPIYTSPGLLSHASNEAGQNRALVEVIDRHEVALVLQGHNHWYERFFPSNCAKQGRAASRTPCEPLPGDSHEGASYITSGAAGSTVIPICGPGGLPGQAVCDTRNHFLVIDADGQQLRMQAIATTHQVFPRQHGAQQVIDTLLLKKPSSACAKQNAGLRAMPDAMPSRKRSHFGLIAVLVAVVGAVSWTVRKGRGRREQKLSRP